MQKVTLAVGPHLHMCTHVCGLGSGLQTCSSHVILLVFETESLISLELSEEAVLAGWPVSPRDPHLPDFPEPG